MVVPYEFVLASFIFHIFQVSDKCLDEWGAETAEAPILLKSFAVDSIDVESVHRYNF